MTRPLLLRIEHATVVRGGRRILDDICLTVEAAQHTAILGPNGSGKSSLVRLVTRELYPSSATGSESVVEVFGKARWDVFDLRSELGIVTTDLHSSFAAHSEATVVDAVLSGFFASLGVALHQEVTPAMIARADSALHLAQASHLRDRRLANLSTGELRRMLIARALVSEPKALLLDEPTTGLDIGAMRRFIATVRFIAQSSRTVLLVTHHVEEIIPEVDRVVLMKDGRVFADGAKSEILTSSALSELFEEDIAVTSHGGFYRAGIAS